MGLFHFLNLSTFWPSLNVIYYFFKYPGHQACNFNLLCVAIMPQCTQSCTLLNNFFLGVCGGGGNIMSPLPFSVVSLCLTYLKGLSAIEQVFPIFLILSSIWLNTGSCLTSIRSRFGRNKTLISTQ